MAEKVVIGSAELWHGDCREVLPLLPEGAGIVSDPPYGIGYARGTGGGAGAHAAGRNANRMPSMLIRFMSIGPSGQGLRRAESRALSRER